MADMEEIHRALGSIEGKLDGFGERFDRLDDGAARVEKRIGALEGWRKWMTGVQAAILAVCAVFIRLIK